jgi:hypothetical protein
MHLNYKSGYWTPVHEKKQSYMRLPYILFTKTLRDQIRIQLRQFDMAIFRVDVPHNQGPSPREIALHH